MVSRIWADKTIASWQSGRGVPHSTQPRAETATLELKLGFQLDVHLRGRRNEEWDIGSPQHTYISNLVAGTR
jgi:hypothetical protein